MSNRRRHGEGFSFSEANKIKAEEIIRRYPLGQERSAVLPLLNMAQCQNGGWLSQECIVYVGALLKMPEMRVQEVASFYSMLHLTPKGTYHIQVCGTPPCWLCDSGKIVKACKKWLGIDVGETTADGKFSLSEVECLGACTKAPVVQINDDYHESLTDKRMEEILEGLVGE